MPLLRLIRILSVGAGWIIIPFLYKIFEIFIFLFILIRKKLTFKRQTLSYHPMVTLLVPVYNSSLTLEACLNSITEQTYPVDQIEVFLIDNGSKDNSFEIFQRFQMRNPSLKVWFYYSESGKSKALNKGIYSSKGQYIINIDSDGRLDRHAIMRVVETFESDPEISCMSGTVLVDPRLVLPDEKFFLKHVQGCEYIEYIEAFLIGRNVSSEFNRMYTMAGAFSCFRKKVIVNSQLYNSETLGEDTHMTFQVKEFMGGVVSLCEGAFFYVDPIEDLNKLYTQRQRWQRSEIEVAKLFSEKKGILSFIKDTNLRVLLIDHTMVIARLQWSVIMLILGAFYYDPRVIMFGFFALYLLTVVAAYLYTFMSIWYLSDQKETQWMLIKKLPYVALMPIYRSILATVRILGIINCMSSNAKWRTRTLTDEIKEFIHIVKTNYIYNIQYLYIFMVILTFGILEGV